MFSGTGPWTHPTKNFKIKIILTLSHFFWKSYDYFSILWDGRQPRQQYCMNTGVSECDSEGL